MVCVFVRFETFRKYISEYQLAHSKMCQLLIFAYILKRCAEHTQIIFIYSRDFCLLLTCARARYLKCTIGVFNPRQNILKWVRSREKLISFFACTNTGAALHLCVCVCGISRPNSPPYIA